MNTKNATAVITQAIIYYSDRPGKNVSDVEWEKHPSFRGVYLKHMITGSETGGRFSSHLVRIDPHSCLDLHAHERHMELHEVIDGNGTCRLKDEVVDYRSGTMAVIPVGEHHRVEAGDDGLTLLAKFVPSLV
ncbi:hypothetical protein JCM14469_32660 [Desulfatiferula olefinivorans]